MDDVRELAPQDRARLWLVRTDRRPEDDDGRGAGVLDEGELRRAAGFRFARHRARYVAAHLALRGILGEHLGCAPGDVRFVREPCPECDGPHGRPAVADTPDLHFSLSHSGDLALIALAPAPVGADVEELPTAEVARDLAVVLHPRERAELDGLDAPSEHQVAVGRAWVRKEAYLKGLGTGLARAADLDYVGTLPDAPGAPDGWAVRDVPVPDGYLAAVAVAPD
ncbi:MULTISPECIES: 4'-phosphopantetheinyl transferase superfamily protein [unclassified Streptomyces]|uniref:4'-phosphopantetheinyl transferase family protein n=1 Tax=unclassified Streptomyces TaxID=2593676 RepID=UPI000DB92ACB|nr:MULTISPECIES: 4'-phosphopantetheinyl transferase superfamily protein [unclassified Streptomyces]MYT73887.1 4'-phosphopantetheinyl transferase superfamily protein [Streptomyces sp. SID8367]RAJ89300.1 4'-phosphopantetheinyl transferase [Streptomyces sp. PsTaAH-137]